MRLIDADALLFDLTNEASPQDGSYGRGRRAVIEELKKAPTIDPVPVVRCKNCKHFKSETENTGICDGGFCNAPVHVAVIDFCSAGERKDNETD